MNQNPTPNNAMNVSLRFHTHNPNSTLSVTADVGKDDLHLHTQIPLSQGADKVVELHIANRNRPIQAALAQYAQLAQEHRLEQLRLVCEPTGGYERRLLRLARQAGHQTAYLNTESVKQLRVVESNDSTKSDEKDPRTMFLLVKLGKTLTHRSLSEPWLALREWGMHYSDLEAQAVAIRGRLHRVLMELFCELSFKVDFLFRSPTALKVVQAYGLNPYRMVQDGQTRCLTRLKRAQIRRDTAQRLWADAQRSVLQQLPQAHIELLELRLREGYADYQRCRERMDHARQRMVGLLHQLQHSGQVKLRAVAGVINEFLLARILGETGPLKDFDHWRQLLRYGGFNLRLRESGQYKGYRRLSKKGRAGLRKVTMQAVLPRVRKQDLFGEEYHRRKAKGVPGQKALVTIARKYLKMLWGWEHSSQAFDRERVFVDLARWSAAHQALAA
jgi:transposase